MPYKIYDYKCCKEDLEERLVEDADKDTQICTSCSNTMHRVMSAVYGTVKGSKFRVKQ